MSARRERGGAEDRPRRGTRFFWLLPALAVLFLAVGLLLATPVGRAETAVPTTPEALEGVAGEGQAIYLLESGARSVVFEVVVPWERLRLDAVEVEGCAFTRVSLPGWRSSAERGAPKLPVALASLGVPYGAELSVTAHAGPVHTIALVAPPARAEIVPDAVQPGIQQPGDGDADGLPELLLEPDVQPAERWDREAYPGRLAALSGDGLVRQQRVVGILAFPVQYDPLRGELTVYERLTITLSWQGGGLVEESPARAESDAYEGVFRGTLLNYEAARRWRSSSVLAAPASAGWRPPVPGHRIAIEQAGFYRLTYPALQSAGLPVDGLDPRTLQVFAQGSEVAVWVTGEGDGHFDPGDELLFYAQPIFSKYARQTVLWLSYGQALGRRMASRDGAPTNGATPAPHMARLHMEKNARYISVLAGDENLERYTWDYVYPPSRPSWSHTFSLPTLAGSGSTARLTVALFGYLQNPLNPDHHTRVYVNGTLVEDAWWDGVEWRVTTVEFPLSLLMAGQNTISVVCPNDTGLGYDLVHIDWAELEYASTFTAQSETLGFRYTTVGTWRYQANGFSSSEISVFDVTQRAAPVRITGGSVELSGSSYQVRFRDVVAAPTEYVILAPGAVGVPVVGQLDLPSNLQSSTNGADHVIITHRDFWDQAVALRDHRASLGMRAVVVDVQDVYDEFGYGQVGAAAIRDFLAYAYARWAPPAPSFVVLLGDGHYDPKNYLNYGQASYMPPFLAPVDPWLRETAGDNRYVTVAGEDPLPDLMLGRMPANTPAEAAAMVSKVLAYEQSPTPGDWRQSLLFVADNADQAGNFAAMSDQVISCCLPAPYQPERVYLEVTHQTPSEAKAALLGALNQGRSLVHYIGHAGADAWASEGILQSADVPSLSNSARLPIMLPMTCSEGYYHYPHPPALGVSALAEVLLRADGKGSVAGWSPSGYGVASGHSALDEGFMRAVFEGRTRTLGQAATAGKLALWATGWNLDLLDTYLVFGDPALQMNVLQAELGVAMSVAPTTPLRPTDVVTFTLSIVNQGPDTAYGIVLTDLVPEQVVDPELVSSSLVISRRPGTEFVWDVADLPAGQGGTVVFRGRISGSAGLGWFANTARIESRIWDPGALANESSTYSLVIAGAPSQVSVSAAPGQIPVGGSVSSVEAVVRDAWGNLVADGTPVAFSTNLGTITPTSATTINGRVVTSLTSGSLAGLATVSVSSGTALGGVGVRFVPGQPALVQVTANPARLPVGGASSSLVATVRDAFGNAVADGTLVAFSTTLGSVSPGSVPTGGGMAQTSLVSGVQAGSAAVRAQAGSAVATVIVPFDPGPAAGITLAASPPSVGVGGQAQLTATVVDAFGNRVADGTSVQFSTNLGTVQPASGLTTNGQAGSTLLAGTVAGEATVSATSGGAAGAVQVPILPGQPATIELDAFPVSIPITGTAQLQASVRDPYGNAVADGTPVVFQTTLGMVAPPSGVTLDGLASAQLSAQGLPGLATVTAQSGSASDSVQVRFGEGAPVAISLSAFPSEIPADGSSTADVTAWVLDVFGQPITRTIPITFATSLGQVNPAVAWVVNGTATTQLSGTQTGSALVTAVAAQASAQVAVVLVPGGPHAISLSVSPGQVPVGGQAAVSLQVTDAFGNPVSDGTPVTLASTLGYLNPAQVSTVGGTAQSTFVAGWVSGQAVVSATAGLVTGSAGVTVMPGPAAALSVSADPPVLYADGQGQAAIEVIVADAHGNPVADGTAVSLTATGATATPGVAFTSSGVASGTLTAGTVAGAATLAAVSGAASGSIEVPLLAGPAAVLALSVSPGAIPADGQAQATLAVLVTDAFGNAVADGTTVTFTTSLGGVYPHTATTQSGAVQSTLQAGTVAGTANVAAASGEATGTAQVTLLPGDPDGIQVVATPATLPADGTSTAQVAATLVDGYGNRVQDGTPVLFATTLGSVQPASAVTHTGVATTTLQSATSLGEAILSARSGQAIGQTTVPLVAGPPASALMTADPASLVADGASQAQVRVLVQDAWGHPVANGTEVSFSTTLGTVTPGSAITSGGLAWVGLTAATALGTAEVSSQAGAAQGLVRVPMVAGPPATLSLSAADLSLPVDGRMTTTMTASIVDAWQHPVASGTPVTFTASLGSVAPQVAAAEGGVAHSLYTGVRAGTWARITATTIGGLARTASVYLDASRTFLPAVLAGSQLPFQDLSVTQAGVAETGIWTSIPYTITWSNQGNVVLHSVVITDVVPAGSYWWYDNSGVTPTHPAPNTWVWHFAGPLGPGERRSFVAIISVGSYDVIGTHLINTVTASAQSLADRDPADNRSQWTTLVSLPDLVMEKAGPASAYPGSSIAYTLTYHNVGRGRGLNVVITDTLPVGVTYLSDTSGQEHSEPLPGVHVWQVGVLAPREDGQFKLFVRLGSRGQTGSVITNRVEIGAWSPDLNPANNWAEWTTIVQVQGGDALWTRPSPGPPD